MDISFHKPHLPKTAIDEVVKVLQSGWLTTGPKVQEFEQQFSEVIGARYSLAVSSCTAALHLAYLVHDFKEGDEIIVPSFTFCSTINTLMHVGATPVFCDIERETLCLDPSDVLKKITPKTKAIVVVHYAGMPANMDSINAIAKEHNLIVIEDAAHAFLTKYKGKYIGSSTNTTCFSFYATKNLTTAEGGMITISDSNFAEQIETLRMHGISKKAWNRYGKTGTWKYDVLNPGYKYNMTDISAVLGIEQLKRLNEAVKKRSEIVEKYFTLFSKNNNLVLPNNPRDERSQHAWHLFTIQLKDSARISRDDLIQKLKEKGIGTSVHFIPNHLQTFYKETLAPVHLPVTEDIFQRILSIPLYEDLRKEEIEYIAKSINELTS